MQKRKGLELMKARLFWAMVSIVGTSLTGLAQANLDNGLYQYELRNFAVALPEIAAAATAGNADAQYIIGRMYAHGEGVGTDLLEASKWFTLAAEQGHRLAAIAGNAVQARMTPDQLQSLATLSNDDDAGEQTTRTAIISGRELDARSITDSSSPSETLVTEIQLNLKRLGYSIDTIDGQVNDQTSAAVEQYQADNNLPATEIDQALLEHLRRNGGVAPAIRPGRPTIVPSPESGGSFRKLL